MVIFIVQYSDGSVRRIATLALARFNNPEGLTKIGGIYLTFLKTLEIRFSEMAVLVLESLKVENWKCRTSFNRRIY